MPEPYADTSRHGEAVASPSRAAGEARGEAESLPLRHGKVANLRWALFHCRTERFEMPEPYADTSRHGEAVASPSRAAGEARGEAESLPLRHSTSFGLWPHCAHGLRPGRTKSKGSQSMREQFYLYILKCADGS